MISRAISLIWNTPPAGIYDSKNSSNLRCIASMGRGLRYIVASDDELFGGGQEILRPRFSPRSARLAGALRPHGALGQKLLKPMDVVIAVDEIGVAHERAEQRQRGLDAVDHELVDRPPQPHEAFAARLAVHDELAEQRIVIRRACTAPICRPIDPPAHAARRLIMLALFPGRAAPAPITPPQQPLAP